MIAVCNTMYYLTVTSKSVFRVEGTPCSLFELHGWGSPLRHIYRPFNDDLTVLDNFHPLQIKRINGAG